MRTDWQFRVAMAILAAFLGSACTPREKTETKSQADAGAVKVETAPTRVTLKASEDDCVGPVHTTGKPRTLQINGIEYQLDGYLLKQVTADPYHQVVLGVISDTKENSEENRKNLKAILEVFNKEKVEAILHLGDVASVPPLPEEIELPDKGADGKELSQEQKDQLRRLELNKARREAVTRGVQDIVEMISVLAESELPVFVVIGNRECKSTFNMALDTLAEDFPNVFNLNFVRRVDLDGVDIISQPGYHDPEYMHCAWDRCLYYESDTLVLEELAKECNDPVLLISHGPPRQKDRNGIDVVADGANVGNPWLTRVIEKAGIKFGAFGNIQEAGGKAVSLDGSNIYPQDVDVESLYLNPGPADSMSWSMNDGTESRGMAAVLKIKDGKARYKIYRVGEKK